MTIVQTISKKAERALLAAGVTFEYGYGDAYHFRGVPGKTSVDIDAPFTLGEQAFVMVGSRLQLATEGRAKKQE